ncbi:MAG: ligase-associated DNA damage response endonuclease PdeM [Saprospiraceae bacterium]|nr:ligase-associated DNA damage response endonuclease PdeM [Saprospiraceae bacterium]
MEIKIKDVHLQLLPEKAIFIKESRTLVISDLHLGKVTHFRNSGIAVPAASEGTSMQMLSSAIEKYTPSDVWFLGDLFHSVHNNIWEQFSHYVKSRKEIAFTLIKGNHDILSDQCYADAGIVVVEELKFNEILFTHEPLDYINNHFYNIAGHIHPGVILRGKGRQYLRLPCFLFGIHNALIPAFGHFTGIKTVEPREGDKVYVVGDNQIFEFSK